MPEGQFETLGGFVLATLGHIPEVGEQFFCKDWSIAVEQMQGRRIATVKLVAPVPETLAGIWPNSESPGNSGGSV
jgi:putative hemolysin